MQIIVANVYTIIFLISIFLLILNPVTDIAFFVCCAFGPDNTNCQCDKYHNQTW